MRGAHETSQSLALCAIASTILTGDRGLRVRALPPGESSHAVHVQVGTNHADLHMILWGTQVYYEYLVVVTE